MPDTKPFSIIAAWKRRTQREEQWIFGGNRIIDYVKDDDPDISGVQNVVTIDNIPHDPASEIIDVFLIGANREGRHALPRLREFPFTVDLSATIDSVTTSVTVTALGKANDWPDKAFVLLDDGTNREIMQITSGGGTTSWTVRRGEHGTSAAGFSIGTTVRRLYFNVPHREITLSGDATKLDPPSIAVEGILNGFHFTFTPPSDPGNRLRGYIIYRAPSPAPTTAWKTPLATSDDTFDGEFFLGFGEDKTATWYFRAKSFTRFGLISDSYSNEVSAQVLTQPDSETPWNVPTAPTVTVAANGGDVSSGFLFTVAVTFTDTTGAGAVTKTEIQVAEPGVAHDTATGFASTVFTNSDFSRPPVATDVRVSKSSAAVGGAYQFTARLFGSLGSQWSAYSTPVTALTTVGSVDAGPPGAANYFDIEDASGVSGFLGNAVFAQVQGPETNINTVYGYELQASASLWSADAEDTLGLTILESGTGDITTGGTVMTAVTLVGSHSNKILYIYDTIDIATGEIEGDYAAVIDTNTSSTITLRSGYAFPKNATGISFAIGTWKPYDYRPRETITRGPLSGGGAAPGNGFFISDVISFSKTAYWRTRFLNRNGRGVWRYHDGSTGTTTRTSATTFTPAQIQTPALSDGSVTPAKATEELQAVAASFTPVPDATSPHRKFAWAAFTIYFSDGTSLSIDAGDSGLLTSNTQYWAYATIGSSTLTITATISSTVGTNKITVASIRTAGVSTESISIVSRFARNIVGVGVLNVGELSAITADIGEVTAGTITGVLIRTAASGARIELTGSVFASYDATFKRIELASTGDQFKFYATGGAHCATLKGGSAFDFDIERGQTSGDLNLGTSSKRWAQVMVDTDQVSGSLGFHVTTRDNGTLQSEFKVDHDFISIENSSSAEVWRVGTDGVQRIGSSTGPKFLAGSGSPEGVVTAPISSLYMRTDGGSSTSIYVKEAGTGNTGWVAK